MECPSSIDVDGTSCFIIDAQALIWAVGKPSECGTFAAYAEYFMQKIIYLGRNYQCIDICFDRYQERSIKESTRK